MGEKETAPQKSPKSFRRTEREKQKAREIGKCTAFLASSTSLFRFFPLRRQMRLLLAITIVALLCATPALAWWCTGHMLVANVARRSMCPSAYSQVCNGFFHCRVFPLLLGATPFFVPHFPALLHWTFSFYVIPNGSKIESFRPKHSLIPPHGILGLKGALASDFPEKENQKQK